MTHDPLCVHQPEHHDGSILWPARCDCDVIARVREDCIATLVGVPAENEWGVARSAIAYRRDALAALRERR